MYVYINDESKKREKTENNIDNMNCLNGKLSDLVSNENYNLAYTTISIVKKSLDEIYIDKDKILLEIPKTKKLVTFTILNHSFNFKLIELPKNLLHLYDKYYKIKCEECKTIPTYSLLCLICDTKVCFTRAYQDGVI